MKLSRQQILKWCGEVIFAKAERQLKQGAVMKADVQGDVVDGLFATDSGPVHCRFRVPPNGLVESDCPCYDNQQRGIICVHVAALALHVLARQNDPVRQQMYIEEQRHARRMQAGIAQAIPIHPKGIPARLLLELPADWRRQFAAGAVAIRCAFLLKDTPAPVFPEKIDRRRALALSEPDALVLQVLEDMAENGLTVSLPLSRIDFLGFLDVCRGRDLLVVGGRPVHVEAKAVPFVVFADLDRETGELLVFPKAKISGLPDGAPQPEFLVELEKSWAFGGGRLWPLKPTLPLPYQSLYKGLITIPREAIPSFLAREVPRLREGGTPFEFEPDASPDCFTTTPGEPAFHLALRGSQEAVSAELHAVYGGKRVPAVAPEVPGDVAVPDPDDFRHFSCRNLPAERRALARLTTAGFRLGGHNDLQPITGSRSVLNILGGLVPSLRRLGWTVEVEGRLGKFYDGIDMAVPVVNVGKGGRGSFDVSLEYSLPSTGAGFTEGQIQHAIRCGESFLEYNGHAVLLDTDAIAAMREVFRDCDSRPGRVPGHFELPSVYAPYVQSSLAALDGVVTEAPPDWRARAEQCNRDTRMTPEPLGALEGTLRPYQKEGVYWMRFLERSGFSGILADEMGLGKTLQTLTWLSLERAAPEARGKPALVVAPTSLVENWRRECEKFTPWRTCVVMSGTGRHAFWDKLAEADLVVTSYALLRRDIEHYAGIEFSAAVLDEAQHIKNRSTQNAQAAKQIRAVSRLVLSGTPIENGVADLWSIMDFLMPGYLGDYDTFKAGYEDPIAAGEQAAEEAQSRLHRKLRPFLLRRLKKDVAKDLPDKIQKVSFSALSEEQDRLYATLLAAFRQKVGDLVAAKGFDHCRMEVLAILLRLRQACCHLALLPEEMRGRTPMEAPSAKTEQFFELLDEAVDGGHRVLVFSQFVGMLSILRRELERRGLRYCYLDGATTDRLEECRRFNQDPGIPVFLISLKAGGTGLNLTGADMVVHFDPWWNPAVEDQATDRAHRIGQKRTVVSVKLIAEGTVEEKVLALQRRKQALIQATVGTNDESLMKSLSWDDVRELLA